MDTSNRVLIFEDAMSIVVDKIVELSKKNINLIGIVEYDKLEKEQKIDIIFEEMVSYYINTEGGYYDFFSYNLGIIYETKKTLRDFTLYLHKYLEELDSKI